MTATATTETVPVEIKDYTERDARTNTLVRYTAITGLPGLPPDRRLITVLPVGGQPKDLMFSVDINGGTVLKAWSTEKHFVGSRNFPEGIDLGVVRFFTDIGMGQPYPEKSEMQVGEEGYLRLRAYAEGKGYLSMGDRRRIYEDSERQASLSAMKVKPGAPAAPAPAASPVDLDALIAKRVAEGIEAMSDEIAARAMKKIAAQQKKDAEAKKD